VKDRKEDGRAISLIGGSADRPLEQGIDTVRYDSEYVTCGKKLTGSQLSLPHGINKKKLKCET